MANGKTLRHATSTDDRTINAKWVVFAVDARELTRWAQPPDAENRMSGGVGGLTGAIPLARPDQAEMLPAGAWGLRLLKRAELVNLQRCCF